MHVGKRPTHPCFICRCERAFLYIFIFHFCHLRLAGGQRGRRGTIFNIIFGLTFQFFNFYLRYKFSFLASRRMPSTRNNSVSWIKLPPVVRPAPPQGQESGEWVWQSCRHRASSHPNTEVKSAGKNERTMLKITQIYLTQITLHTSQNKH